ncbi:MAG: hypothetical protein KF690_04605 [Bacteroidetes bacterium]|nr:hypothetical protein [Bacteroidota bacterium]
MKYFDKKAVFIFIILLACLVISLIVYSALNKAVNYEIKFGELITFIATVILALFIPIGVQTALEIRANQKHIFLQHLTAIKDKINLLYNDFMQRSFDQMGILDMITYTSYIAKLDDIIAELSVLKKLSNTHYEKNSNIESSLDKVAKLLWKFHEAISDSTFNDKVPLITQLQIAKVKSVYWSLDYHLSSNILQFNRLQ